MDIKLTIEIQGEAPRTQTEELVEIFDYIVDELTEESHAIKFLNQHYNVFKLGKKEYLIQESQLECLCQYHQSQILNLDEGLVIERIEGRILFTALANSMFRIKELNEIVGEEMVNEWKENEEYIKNILGNYARRPDIFKQA